MPVTIEEQETQSLVRLEGECTLTSAAEIREGLLQALTPGRDLRVDLERVEDFDLTLLQLLWAAGREAEQRGVKMAVLAPERIRAVAGEVGFEGFGKTDEKVTDGQGDSHSR